MKYLSVLIFVLVGLHSEGQTIQKILDNGPDNQLVNFVIMGDGYTSSEQSKLETDANHIVDLLYEESPFKEYKNFFNVHLISAVSVDSGADHPGTDIYHDTLVNGQLLFPVQTIDTRYNSTFDYDNLHRLLVPQDETAILTDLMNLMPNYDQVLMLVNHPEYGGAGGQFATTSTHEDAPEIAIHELGHSFAYLGDEYYAGDQYFAEKPNMTMESNPTIVKWNEWFGTNGVGLNSYTCTDTSYCDKGDFINYQDWNKPVSFNCKMEVLEYPFCSVCKEAIVETIYSLIPDPFLNRTPANGTPSITNGQDRTFGVNLIYPSPNTLQIEWYLNGNEIVGRTSDSEVFNFADFVVGGPNILEMKVFDATTLSKAYLPQQGYEFTSSWNINVIDNCGTTHAIAIDNYSEAFSAGCCTIQPTQDDRDWILGTTSTPTNGTGPKGGFIFEDIPGGTDEYLFIEGDEGPKLTSIYASDCFDLTDVDDPQFEFRYVMSGADVSNLEVLVQTQVNIAPVLIAEESGDQGVEWKRILIDLKDYNDVPYIRFFISAITGDTPLSDIAIDQIRVFDKCDQNITLPSSRDHRTIFDIDMTNYIKSSAIIHNTGDVIYNASDSIVLDPGFTVNSTGELQILNDGCGN